MSELAVIMNKSVASTDLPNHKPGDELEVDQKAALEYVDAGWADPAGWDRDDYSLADDSTTDPDEAAANEDQEGQEYYTSESAGPDEGSGQPDYSAFLDRTPMQVVIDDIEAGEADGDLENLLGQAERKGVQDAIKSRMEETG